MDGWLHDALFISIALLLVVLNGFFVAAEFALVKVRLSQIDALVQAGRPFAKTARWLTERLDASLSACQLGITMASLALGWVGEPAFAHLLLPLFKLVGVQSEEALHIASFIVAFSAITTLHLVIGEQAPKIFAIRRPEQMILWCAAPMKFFYIILYPFLVVLNKTTAWLLKKVGIDGASEHGSPHTVSEIRHLLRESHVQGNLSRAEHRLLNAVFEFEDLICRRVMVPRKDVVFFDEGQSVGECLAVAKSTKHTRYPYCNGSLDDVRGVIHMKDLLGVSAADTDFKIDSIKRPVHKVPEKMPISKLLKHFQATHQLLAFVVDEYGNVIGIVTLENVLESIVGAVEDEFDTEEPRIKEEGPGNFVVSGSTLLREIEKRLELKLDEGDVDTVAGVLMSRSGKLPTEGDKVAFDGAMAEIIEVERDHATKVRFTLDSDSSQSDDL
ncbi:hemolysin family protein [Adhaeretor mobilis]|uniref:Magnesium and cobalt efflux protein CorC n=1 Tax=Adhaeretor mobilis TaxID=1930276 RepID=A0A517MZG7_9BACT|nr:hemolysin family protein [Adhaeretor mobilis]QDT00277.1 Magnesium and cobalt efflux protein CorC [Adhaeretor mobilis]